MSCVNAANKGTSMPMYNVAWYVNQVKYFLKYLQPSYGNSSIYVWSKIIRIYLIQYNTSQLYQ